MRPPPGKGLGKGLSSSHGYYDNVLYHRDSCHENIPSARGYPLYTAINNQPTELGNGQGAWRPRL